MGQCCNLCKNYSELKETRKANEECFVYGFCFKDYYGNHGSVHPVYIPNSSSTCKKFSRKIDANIQNR